MSFASYGESRFLTSRFNRGKENLLAKKTAHRLAPKAGGRTDGELESLTENDETVKKCVKKEKTATTLFSRTIIQIRALSSDCFE